MMVMNTAPRADAGEEDWIVTPEMVRGWEAEVAAAVDAAAREVGFIQILGH